ncbi:MAG: FadR family transcriptional regulator [Anaerolineales bacterium]|nr:FadR family transcriptional regulator [Anaerolineales bacterium]
MLRERTGPDALSEFLRYLARHEEANGERLPALSALSQELDVSIASLREQLEVARALGLVEVKPRTGMKRLPYSFTPAVRQSLGYAITHDKNNFEAFADLRQHVEIAYWYEAVALLTPEDQENLRNLVTSAWEKLRGNPIQIPHEEHRELHLGIYRRLNNPFVTGLLEAYWGAYEAVGFNFYTDLNYLEEVWRYHQKMVDSIRNQDFDSGYKALNEHTDLIYQLIASTSS